LEKIKLFSSVSLEEVNGESENGGETKTRIKNKEEEN